MADESAQDGRAHVHSGGDSAWKELWRNFSHRATFLADISIHVILDSFFLIAFYYWKVFVNYIVFDFEQVQGGEKYLFFWVKYALILVPIVIVSWYLFVDLLGVIRRTWERR